VGCICVWAVFISSINKQFNIHNMEGRPRFYSAGYSPSRYSSDGDRGRSPRGGSSNDPSSIPTAFDRMPRTREKLSDLPTFRENLRNYSPSARRSGEDILNVLKNQMKDREDFFNSTSPRNSYINMSKVSLLMINTQFVCTSFEGPWMTHFQLSTWTLWHYDKWYNGLQFI